MFVYLAAPGDVVRVEVERTRGKVAFASIKEIIKPSPLRVEPPCPYFGRCGGCDFQQLDYETQLQTKVEIIRDCLHRLGGFDPVPDFEIQPSPNEWHYRARANWQVDRTTEELGYFERGSNRVCDVEFCAVLVPELQAELERVRAGNFPQSIPAGTLKQLPETMASRSHLMRETSRLKSSAAGLPARLIISAPPVFSRSITICSNRLSKRQWATLRANSLSIFTAVLVCSRFRSRVASRELWESKRTGWRRTLRARISSRRI